MAATEIKAFGDLDAPDLYYQFYSNLYGDRKGTMVPFSFRLLAAEIPAYNNQINETQDKLCQLLAKVRRINKEIEQFYDGNMNEHDKVLAAKLWAGREVQVINSLINCALMKKDFHNAIHLLEQQLLRDTSKSEKSELYSSLGRVYLHLGDVHRAQRSFNSASQLREGSTPKDLVSGLVENGLVAVAQNLFHEAHEFFTQALTSDPDNSLLVNNAAVCLLYMGRMQESMMLLEENLGIKPNAMINSSTVLNVCTLYELESSLTTQRKLGMLRLASQWKNDNLSDKAFKLALP
nr:EOG090X0439 [Polyphemus pediculus]